MASNSTTLPSGFVEGSWWYYLPNKIAPVVFAVLFLISGCWHLYQNIVYKCWKTTGLLPFAALVFVEGYVLREVGAFHPDSLAFYMASTIELLCSPPVYEAANCFIVTRFLYYVPYRAPLHPWRLMLTLGTFEAYLEAINANGAAEATSYRGSNVKSGKILMNISLVCQIISMLFFIGVTFRFEYNCRRVGLFPDKLRNGLRVVYVSCALISMRTIYRSVEWFDAPNLDPSNPDSFPPVLRTEAYFYVFEASVMLINTFLLNIFHPTRLIPQNYKVYLAPDGVTELEGRGMTKDPRPYWLQWVDPFDLYGLFTKRDEKINFWLPETDASSTTQSDHTSDMEKQGWGNWKTQDKLVQVV
ncbi:hypothetical protein CALCODRAFT_519810 [Calocera cornea HHB12733]|uniref:RTA1 domain protein n=1 Tax=Calocera cornea HHB12733 TaxID=1353952 RepID=A0A165DZK3_9BASI|nr:hypothetical protein CALCODRAFT_519810 [Calocera cornea HHB12733]